MSEQQHNPQYKVGDEVSVEFMGRVTEVALGKDYGVLGSKEKIIYTVQGSRGMRGSQIEESCIYPLPQPKDFGLKE